MTARKFVPLNLKLELDDGRILIVKRGISGTRMKCRQIGHGPVIREGEVIKTAENKEGVQVSLVAEKRTKKDLYLKVYKEENQ